MPPLHVVENKNNSRSRIAAASSALVVPVPVPCVLDVTQGRPLCRVEHAPDAANFPLSEGNLIRVHHPYHSSNFEVSSCCASAITLTRPYDHTPITEREDSAKRFEDAVERLHCPYSSRKDGIGVDGDGDVDNGSVRTAANSISSSPKRRLLEAAASDTGNASGSRATVPVNMTLLGTRVWRLVTLESDKRSQWRRQYDDGDAPSDLTFDLKTMSTAEAEGTITHFRIPLQRSTIVAMCQDVPYGPERSVHQQRVQYFDRVAVDFVVRETYQAVCDWHPACSTIDNVKWARLSRKMGFLASVRNTSHEIDMAFLRRCQDRKLDLDRFRALLEDVALVQHPRLELRPALKKLLWNTVVMLPHVNERVWSEAKALAISVEARRNCAQIRLAAIFRKTKHCARYCQMVAAATCIAKYARMRIQVVRKFRRLEDMELERLRRLRERSATQCQKIWRGHFCQVSYRWRLAQIVKCQREKSAELRRKLKSKRARRDASIICRFARSLQGHQVVVTMCRHGVSDSDSHLLMRVYLPVVQKTFDFCFPEQTLQLYTQQILEREGCMSWKEMLKPEVLKGLVDRLMIRRVNGVPIVIFSKRNLAEKGRLIAKKLIRGDDNGGIYLLSIYKSTVDFTFCLYDPASCNRIRTSLSHAALHKWLSDEARLVHNANDSRSSRYPRYRSHPSLALLLPGRQGDLVEWLSTRLSVKTSPDTGHRRVLFQFEIEQEKAERLACRIQSVVRKLAARARARTMIREHFEKVFDRESGAYYYVNSKTGACQWTKPILLGDDDLDFPKDEWRRIDSGSSRPGKPSAYYHNPATGQLSWLSEEEAARMLQRRVRERQATDITGPKLDFATVASAVKFINDAERAFAEQPDRLSHKVNYAMVCHCLKFDYDQAKQQYEEAIQRCPSHPVIGRAYAILLLAMPRPTSHEGGVERNHVTQKALDLFREAEIGDPTARMFRLAIQNCFLWAVVVHPRNPLALLNSALLQQYVLKDPGRADKLYRRALAMSQNAAIVRQNYEIFQALRY